MPRTKKIQDQDNALELETAPKPEGEAAQQPKRRGRKPKAAADAEKKAAEPEEDYGGELDGYDGGEPYGDEGDDGPPWDEEDDDGEEAGK